MHYYQFNIGDFIKDSAHLTLEEEAIYRRLIDHYYTTEKPISLDISIVSRAIRARGKEDLIGLILNEFFIETEKGFKQKRIEKELKNFKDKSKKAKASAEARWGKASKSCDTDANAMRTHSEGNANHKPLTINHKPINNKQDKIPYQQIADLYNECFAIPTNNAQIAKLNDTRKRAIKKLWYFETKDDDIKKQSNNTDFFKRFFSHCASKPFLQGDTERTGNFSTWKPNFEYIMTEKVLIKAIEGTL